MHINIYLNSYYTQEKTRHTRRSKHVINKNLKIVQNSKEFEMSYFLFVFIFWVLNPKNLKMVLP